MKSRVNNEKGATLIFTLVVFVFVSIIATAVISVATNETVHSIDKNKEIQARYNAVSGIEIMTEYVTEYTEDFTDKIDPANYATNFPLTKTIKDGEFTITVENATNGINLVSNGTYRDKNVIVKRFFETIDVTHDFLFGQFYIDSSVYTDYDPVVIPSIDETRSSLDFNNAVIEEVFTSETTEYPYINVRPNGELSFKTHPTGPTTRNVVVDTIDVQGAFNISDDGRVFLFVRNSANFQSEFLNANENLIIMLASGATLNVNISGNDKEFNAYVYGPEADVTIGNANYDFNGAIIAASLNNISGRVDEVYVPPTETLDMLNFIDYTRVYSYEPKRYIK